MGDLMSIDLLFVVGFCPVCRNWANLIFFFGLGGGKGCTLNGLGACFFNGLKQAFFEASNHTS